MLTWFASQDPCSLCSGWTPQSST